MNPVTRILALGLIVALVAGALAYRGWNPAPQEATPHPPPSITELRPPGPPEEPHREYDANREIARVQHKDSNGLSPLERIKTPEGMVTVQRTFSASGALLKEEAFLNGQPVPVPPRPPVTP